METIFSIQTPLLSEGRLSTLAESFRTRLAVSLAVLLGAGAVAAVAAIFDPRLGIPGHAIMRTSLPVLLGLAVVPRRGAGTLMAGSAGLTALLLKVGGFSGLSPGSLTSLLAFGPMLDVAMFRARPGWMLHVRCVAAGLAANGIALAVRLAGATLGLHPSRHGDLGAFVSYAVVTYAICGAAAGLLGAVVAFRLRPSSGEGEAA